VNRFLRLLLLVSCCPLIAAASGGTRVPSSPAPQWTALFHAESQPVVDGDLVLVLGGTDARPRIAAFPLDCARRCRPVWWARTGGRVGGDTVSGGVVYVASDRLFAFDEGCRGRCRPMWTGMTENLWPPLETGPYPLDPSANFLSPPAVGHGVVVVSSTTEIGDTHGANPGRIYAFAEGCANDGGVCAPLWKGQIGRVPGTPVIVGDRVFVATGRGLSVYPLRCRTDGGRCVPTWRGLFPNVVGFGGGPVIGDDRVYVVSQTAMGRDGLNVLMAFPLDCAPVDSVCAPLWRDDTREGHGAYDPFLGTPVEHDGSLFVTSGTSLYRYPATCGSSGDRCEPLWRSHPPGGFFRAPAIDGDRVFVSDYGGHVYAFRANCDRPEGCHAVWHWEHRGNKSAPLVAGGRVYVSGKRDVYAFYEDCARGDRACSPASVWHIGRAVNGMLVVGDRLLVMTPQRLYSFAT